jgi:hypothetical protein
MVARLARQRSQSDGASTCDLRPSRRLDDPLTCGDKPARASAGFGLGGGCSFIARNPLRSSRDAGKVDFEPAQDSLMTVDQIQVVDFVEINPSGRAVLTISDHLSWDDVKSHLFILQEKVNAYLGFIESGEMTEKRPDVAGRAILISVVLKFPIPNEADWFFAKTSAAIEAAGFSFEARTL